MKARTRYVEFEQSAAGWYALAMEQVLSIRSIGCIRSEQTTRGTKDRRRSNPRSLRVSVEKLDGGCIVYRPWPEKNPHE